MAEPGIIAANPSFDSLSRVNCEKIKGSVWKEAVFFDSNSNYEVMDLKNTLLQLAVGAFIV